MKRISIPGLIILLLACLINTMAQDTKKKAKEKQVEEKPAEDTAEAPGPVFNYVIDDPMDAFGPKENDTPATPSTRFFLYPEFYSYWPVTVNDTILKFECYDASHNPLNMDTLQNLGDVHYISFFKTHNDYLHTYIDQEGRPRPTPVSKKLYWYERSGANMWKAFDNLNNYTSLLQEDVSTIVRTDTTILPHPVTGNKQMTVRKYYKVTEVEKAIAVSPGENQTRNTDPEKTTVTNYTVPDFYFHQPKKIKDTTLEFLCYDSRDSLIPEVANYDDVRYYSLYKKFIDSTHTYNDNGQKKPLPVAVIVKRYDRTAPDKWMSVEYPSNKFTVLKGFRNNVVQTDTSMVYDPMTDKTHLKVFTHYKVIKN